MRTTKHTKFAVTFDDLHRALTSVCQEILHRFEGEIGPTDPATRKHWKLDPGDAVLDPTATGKFIGLTDDTCGALRDEGLDMRYSGTGELAGVLKIASSNEASGS